MAETICGYVYELTNKLNGKRYVGLTTGTVETRWKYHIELAEKAIHPTGIRAAIRKYSPEAFDVTTLDTAITIRELIDKEVYYIKARGTRAPNGYNLTKGGELPEGTPIIVNDIELKSIKIAAIQFDIPYKLVYSRLLNRNWTIRQTFGLDPPPILHSHKIDLKGRVFASRAEAARSFGLDPRIVHSRMQAGWSDEEAFGLAPPPRSFELSGKTYNGFNEAARGHGLEPQLVRGRLNKGWTIEQAFGLEPPPRSFEVNARRFNTISEACDALELPEEGVRGRLKRGWTLEEAFEIVGPPNDTSVIVDGVKYPTAAAAAKIHGLDRGVVAFRIRAGWTERQAYGIDAPPPRVGKANTVQIEGNEFPSVSSAARRYGVNPGTVKSRLKLGWTIEQALGVAPKPKRSAHNSLPVELEDIVYPSRSSAAEAYNIDVKLVENRIATGWTLEEAFGLVEPSDYAGPRAVRFRGKQFQSIRAAAIAAGVPDGTVRARLQAGWSV